MHVINNNNNNCNNTINNNRHISTALERHELSEYSVPDCCQVTGRYDRAVQESMPSDGSGPQR